MTDTPASSRPSFGATFVGREFDWTVDPETGRTETFRALASITFAQTQAWHEAVAAYDAQERAIARELSELRNKQRVVSKDVADLARGLTRENVDEATKKMVELEDEVLAIQQQIRDRTNEADRERWPKFVAQVIALVHEPHREELEPYLLEGDPSQVRELYDWLIATVINPVARKVEATERVDPT